MLFRYCLNLVLTDYSAFFALPQSIINSTYGSLCQSIQRNPLRLARLQLHRVQKPIGKCSEGHQRSSGCKGVTVEGPRGWRAWPERKEPLWVWYGDPWGETFAFFLQFCLLLSILRFFHRPNHLLHAHVDRLLQLAPPPLHKKKNQGVILQSLWEWGKTQTG